MALTLPEDPASGIRLGYGGKQIALIPQGGALSEAAAVTDSTVTYPDYFGDGMSLRYTPTLSGVKEDIILDAYAGVSSFTFTLNTGGLNLYQAGGSWFLAENKTAASRIELGDIVAFDAHGRFSIGTMTAETLLPGQSYRLTLTVDEAFLTDASTTYPVTIDPTLTATDGTVTTTAIEDATVYSGSTYGTGQTVVRLSGLLSSEFYEATDADWFTEAKFYATGNSGQIVNLYPMVSNTTWTESSITWANKGTHRTEAVTSVTMAAGSQGAFDILSLLKDWKNGEENANAGFVLVADGSNTAVASCNTSENSGSEISSYAVVTYQSEIWLNTDIAAMDSGAKVTLTAGTEVEGDTVTWTSADTSIATVTQTGDYTCQVTGVRSGKTTVTATLLNGQTATCEIYVTITDGTYFIRHSGGLYLGVDQGMLENTDVEMLEKKSAGPAQLRQIWKIQHIERDVYSIRPVYRLGMSLHVTDDTVDVVSLDT